MRRQFFTGLGWLVALNLVVKPVWIFGIERQVQNAVGNAAYGSYFATLNLTIILLFVADAGLSNLLTQRLAANQFTDTRRAFQLKALLLAGYAVTCLAVGWLSGITNFQLLFYLIGVQCLGSVILFLRSLVAAHQMFAADAAFSVLDKILVILLCAPLIWGWWGAVSIIAFLRLQTIASLTACLALLLFVRTKGLVQNEANEKTVMTLNAIAPFAAIILLMATHYRLDGFLLERLHPDGAAQTGIYAAAYRLLDAANMLGYLAASFLVPFVAKNRNQSAMVQSTTGWLRHGLIVAGLGISCFAALFAPWIQQLLYHTNAAYTNTVIQYSMAVLPAYYITHIYGSVLTATGSFRTFIGILAVSVLINAIANCLLIPSLGAVACCIAALLSQYSCAAACYVAASRQMGWRLSLQAWMMYAVWLLLFAGWLLLLKSLIASVWVILAATGVVISSIAFLQRRRLGVFFKTPIITHA